MNTRAEETLQKIELKVRCPNCPRRFGIKVNPKYEGKRIDIHCPDCHSSLKLSVPEQPKRESAPPPPNPPKVDEDEGMFDEFGIDLEMDLDSTITGFVEAMKKPFKK